MSLALAGPTSYTNLWVSTGSIEQAELGGRDRDVGVLCAESEVASESERKAAADGGALEHGNGGTIERDQRGEPSFDRAQIFTRGFAVAKDLVEFGNVGAAAEMAAGALDDEHARVLSPLDLAAELGQRAPHRKRHRIAPFRSVEP
jgi:hypothetical protein